MSGAIDPKFRVEVEDLYAQYAELLDEGPLEQWPGLFLEDATYRIVTRENHDRGLPLALILCEGRAAIEDRVFAIANTSFTLPRRTRHLISGMRVDTAGATAWHVTANFAVFESLEQSPTACHSAGHYRDTVARDPRGHLRFATKLVICDGSIVPNSLVIPL